MFELYRYNPDGTSSVTPADSSGSMPFSDLANGTQFKLFTSPFFQPVASGTVFVTGGYQLTASPNPIWVPAGQLGMTTLTWTATGHSDVEIRVGSSDGQVLARGGTIGTAATGQWVTDGMMFYLVDANTHDPIAQTQVHLAYYSVQASPQTIYVGPGETLGSTTITWNAPGHYVDMHIGSATGQLFASGGESGVAPTGSWVSDGMQFVAVDTNTKEFLGSVTVSIHSEPLPPPDQPDTRGSKDFIYLGGQLIAIENPVFTAPDNPDSGSLNSPPQLLAGFLSPRQGDIVSGVTQIIGWAIDKSSQPTPISNVQILVDGNVVGTAVYGRDEYDVCRIVGSVCPLQIKWTFDLDTNTLSEGIHQISFVASNSSNPVLSRSSTQTLTVRNHPDIAYGTLTAISSATNSDGRLELFAFSADGALWRNKQASDGAWTGWNSMAGGYFVNNPTIAKNQDGRLQVFSRGPSDSIYTRAQIQAAVDVWTEQILLRWLPEQVLSLTAPAAILNSSGQLEVFTRSLDNSVWNTRQKTPGSTEWTDWTVMSGPSDPRLLNAADPVAVANQDGRLALFVQGRNNELLFNSQTNNGIWPPQWTDMNVTTVFKPAAIKNANNQLVVVVVSADQKIWYTAQQAANAPTWTPWSQIPAADIVSNPVLVLDQANRIELFAQTSGNMLQRTVQQADGSWNNWQVVAPGDNSVPTVSLDAAANLEAFYSGSDGVAYRTVEDGTGAAGWSAPVALNTFITPPVPEDQFNDSTVNASLWAKQDAIGDGVITEASGHLQITVPAGSTHDASPAGNTSVALLQSANNTNFSVEAKFDSAVTGPQGIMAAQDSRSYIRCDVIPSGSEIHAYSAFIENASALFPVNGAISAGSSYWLRLARNGNTWTCSVSTDGVNYQLVNQFIHTLNTLRLGVWAGNQGNERTALVDYFINGPAVTAPGAPSVSVSLTPGTAVLTSNQTQQFNALVSGTQNQNVAWSLQPAAGAGSISANGLYTAPASIAVQQTVTIRAISAADPTKSATATVTLNPSSPGSTNLALGLSATGSDWITDPARVTDGVVDSEQFADLPGGVQWLQLDLGQVYAINGVKLWHYFADGRTYHGVVVQLSNTPDFTSGVTTVFNNDQTNQTGQGVGTDAEYVETSAGKMISFASVNARYVRLWSNGSTANAYNHIIEVAVYGAPTGISVTLTPSTSTLSANQAQQFTATVNGAANQQVTWSILSGGVGTISADGLYTAPTAIAVQQTVMVQATSVADPDESATAAITLNPPPGTANLALGILPTGIGGWVSDAAFATDGSAADSNQFAGLDSGVQWLELDLGDVHAIDGVKLWHYFADDRTYHGVVVQLSPTPDFTTGTTTVFNNDQANQTGQGIGADAEYMETSAGKLISFPAVNARYVRVWSNGSTANPYNHIVELAVYGLP